MAKRLPYEELKRRFKELAELLPQTIFELDEKGNLNFANAHGYKVTGYSRKDLKKGLNALQLFVPEDRKRAKENIRRVMGGQKLGGNEYIALRKDGSTFPVIIYSSPIIRNSRPVGLRGIVVDITQRKRAEEALHATASLLHNILSSATEYGIAATDLDFRFTHYNPTAERLSGYAAEEVLGRTVQELHIRENVALDRFDQAIEAILRNGKYEYDMVSEDENGEKRYVHATIMAMWDETGAHIGYIFFARDITDRVRLEQELMQFKTISDEATFGNAIADLKGNLTYANAAFADMHGYNAEELIGNNLSIFHTEEQMKDVRLLNRRLRKEGSFSAEEVWHVRKDGNRFPALMSATVIKDGKGEARFLSASAIDISERKAAQELLRQREKELEIKTHKLEEMNAALKVLLEEMKEAKNELEEKVVYNVKELVIPQVKRLQNTFSNEHQRAYGSIIESNLENIISPFVHKLSSKYASLTPTEIEVANLINEGRTSEEIAQLLHISPRTVGSHREHMREKLGLKNKKANLRSHLLSLR